MRFLKTTGLWLFLLSLFFASALAFSDSTTGSNWEQLRAFYDAGKLDEALQVLLKEPSASDPNYFYSLGSVYLRMGNPGAAVAYLEKANRLKSFDSDITHNLTLARAALGRIVGVDRLDSGAGPIDLVSDFLCPLEVRTALTFFIFAALLLGLRTYLKRRNLGAWVTSPSGLLGLMGLILLPFCLLAPHLPGSLPAAMSTDRQTIRSGPGEHFLELSQIESGMKLRLLGPSAKDTAPEGPLWYQIKYAGDGVGWVKGSGILTL